MSITRPNSEKITPRRRPSEKVFYPQHGATGFKRSQSFLRRANKADVGNELGAMDIPGGEAGLSRQLSALPGHSPAFAHYLKADTEGTLAQMDASSHP